MTHTSKAFSMKGKLTDRQAEFILHDGMIGRIGCYADKKVYVVPVTYVYDKGYIYAHSQEGMKVTMMRRNPSVCFEVDFVQDMANWRSVVIWGEFQELTNDKEQKAAMRMLADRLLPFVDSESTRPPESPEPAPHEVVKPPRAVFYRIKIEKMTGRYEKTASM
jgi:uncharacterized protein